MHRLSPFARLSALAAILIGLGVAHAVPDCAYRWPGNGTFYAPLTEFRPGVCAGTDLTWARWLAAAGGLVIAAIILVAAWRRRRTATERRSVRANTLITLGVVVVAAMVALLIPNLPLAGVRTATYGPDIPVPMNYFVPLRVAIFAVGLVAAAVILLARLRRHS